MSGLVLAIAALLAGGAAALLAGRRARLASALGAGGAMLGALLGLLPTARVLAGARLAAIDLPWDVPGGRLALAIDPLSAFFLAPIFAMSALAALYGVGYLRSEGEERSLGPVWWWFDTLVAALAVVVAARNAVLFLVAWEVMALASYFLVVFHHERAEVRQAGWIYLVSTHVGVAFLMAFFAMLGRASGSLDFARFAAPAAAAAALFALAVLGFGAKAGFVPLHVWLPEAHPAAPSHVSALLSGVMIKTGIYGLLRALTWLHPWPAWGGALLVGIGIASAVLGALFALAQRDLKRLLAYSSIENVGLIALGIGIGMSGASAGRPAVAALGFAGALLHVWSHAVMKTGLFLGAGSAVHAAGSRDLERLGGLLRRMPVTGAAFLVGAAGLAALPPFAGFASELAIGLAALRGIVGAAAPPATWLAALAGLGAVGGLSTACFAKAAGIAFLGEPRSREAAAAREVGGAMRAAPLVLAAASLALGLGGAAALAAAKPAVEVLLPDASGEAAAALASLTATLEWVGWSGLALLAGVGLAAAGRRALLRGRSVGAGATWDCGYAAPSSRMQYTGTSFAQPIARLAAAALAAGPPGAPPSGLFPGSTSLATRLPDPARARLWDPLFARIEALAAELRWLQRGSAHVYVLYVVLATAALLFWKLG